MRSSDLDTYHKRLHPNTPPKDSPMPPSTPYSPTASQVRLAVRIVTVPHDNPANADVLARAHQTIRDALGTPGWNGSQPGGSTSGEEPAYGLEAERAELTVANAEGRATHQQAMLERFENFANDVANDASLPLETRQAALLCLLDVAQIVQPDFKLPPDMDALLHAKKAEPEVTGEAMARRLADEEALRQQRQLGTPPPVPPENVEVREGATPPVKLVNAHRAPAGPTPKGVSADGEGKLGH